MVNINIDIPGDLHRKIKLTSVVKDTTLKDYVISVLEKRVSPAKSKKSSIS